MQETQSKPRQLHDKILAFLQSLEGQQIYNVTITINCDEHFFAGDQAVRRFPYADKELSFQDFTLSNAPIVNHVTVIRSDPPADWPLK